MNDTTAQLLFAGSWVALLMIRVPWHARSASFRRRAWTTPEEGAAVAGVRALMLPWVAGCLIYAIRPDWLRWADVEISNGMRWTGLPLTAGGIALLAWIHRALGRNFSGTLVLQDDHELVVDGPYRWVRHPMYPTFLLILGGWLLLTGNLLISLPGILGVTLVMVLRTPREERMLVARFGDRYREYARSTGRYLPRGSAFLGRT